MAKKKVNATISINGGEPVDLDKLNSAVARKGHNVGGISAERLRQFVDRIEKLVEEKKAVAEDITGVFAEAKGEGFDVKIIRQLLAIRKQDPSKVEEEKTLRELYMSALGMLPLFDNDEAN